LKVIPIVIEVFP